MTINVSAPGKVIITGEHAVVHDEPALVSALNKRLSVEAERTQRPFVNLRAMDNGRSRREPVWAVIEQARTLQQRWQKNQQSLGLAPDEYIRAAVGEVLSRTKSFGLALSIGTELPVGAGFGSSAAAAAAIVQAVRLLAEESLDETTRSLSHRLERLQHGQPSGIDTQAVCQGGSFMARKEGGRLKTEAVKNNPDGLHVFLTGRPSEGTGELVEYVTQRRDNPDVKAALADLGETARAIRSAFEDGRSFAKPIKTAQRALETIGVVPEPVQKRVRKLEDDGLAAKISGAGARTGPAAGALLVYAPDEPPGTLRKHRALDDTEYITSDLGGEGVR